MSSFEKGLFLKLEVNDYPPQKFQNQVTRPTSPSKSRLGRLFRRLRPSSESGLPRLHSKSGARSPSWPKTQYDPPPQYNQHPNDQKVYTNAYSTSPTYPTALNSVIPSLSTQNIDQLPDNFSLLSAFDTVFIIDDSGSMACRSGVNKAVSHWEQTRTIVKRIVPICAQYDSDGVDIHFLNSSEYRQSVKDPKHVMSLFGSVSPCGGTPTAKRIRELSESYVRECEDVYYAWLEREAYLRAGKNYKEYDNNPREMASIFPKPRNYIIITDGQADDPIGLWDIIVEYARRLDDINAPKRQLGFQFFQVGDLVGVADNLNQLDNTIKEVVKRDRRDGGGSGEEGLRDIVDTVAGDRLGAEGLTDAVVLKTVIGAVSRMYDEKMILQYTPRSPGGRDRARGRGRGRF